MLKLFIGYIFVFFHIQINGFDLLSNFIGYALIYFGLCEFSDIVNFQKAKPWTIGMAIATCIGNLTGLFAYNNVLLIVLNLITVFVSIYIIYLIDTGILEIEQNINTELNSEKLFVVWKFQAILTIGSSVLSLVQNEIIALFTNICALSAIIANIIFLVYIYGVKKVLENSKK